MDKQIKSPRRGINERIEQAREDFNKNIFVDTFNRAMFAIRDKQRKFVIQLGITFLAAFIIGGITGELSIVASGRARHIYYDPISLGVGALSTVVGFFMMLFIFIGSNVLLIQMSRIFTKEDRYDQEREYYKGKTHSYGEAHVATPVEEEKILKLSDNIMTCKDDVIGITTKGNHLAAVNENVNSNVAIFGTSGSKKSVTIMFNSILQAARRGDSMVITDTKGDLYGWFAPMLEAMGYLVKAASFAPSTLKNSDGFNIMGHLNKDTYEETADLISEIIMSNTSTGEKVDYFYRVEQNILTATIKYVLANPMYSEKDKNLKTVFDLLTKPMDEFEAIMLQMKPNHIAYQQFMNFENDDHKGDAYHGMGIRLSKLSTSLIKYIVSTDDIDFTLPGKRKCAYFVILPEALPTYQFLSSAFLTMLIYQLIDYADAQDSQTLPVRVCFLLDELYAAGGIPNLERYLAITRSHNIALKFIVQDIGMLETMYPGKKFKSLVGLCQTKILLGTTDTDTIKMFLDLIGTETIRARSESYQDKKTSILHLHNEIHVSEGEGKKELFENADIAGFDLDKVMVHVLGQRPIFVFKKLPYYATWPGSEYRYYNDHDGCYYNGHPLMKFMKRTNIRKHVPEWYKEYLREEESSENENIATGADSGSPLKNRG